MSSGSKAEPLVGLDPDLPGAAELVEVIHVGRAERRLERAEDRVERHTQALGLHPVDLDEDLGHACAERGLKRREARLRVAVADHLVDDLLELGQPGAAAVLELDLEAARDAQPHDRRRREREDQGFAESPEPPS